MTTNISFLICPVLDVRPRKVSDDSLEIAKNLNADIKAFFQDNPIEMDFVPMSGMAVMYQDFLPDALINRICACNELGRAHAKYLMVSGVIIYNNKVAVHLKLP